MQISTASSFEIIDLQAIFQDYKTFPLAITITVSVEKDCEVVTVVSHAVQTPPIP
jgi:hypothetical protein